MRAFVRGSVFYVAFFCTAFNFARLGRCAAAILLRAEADIYAFLWIEPAAGCDSFRAFAHLAF